MHQYKGRLIVHTGSMFSGKTSSLEKDIKRFKIAGYKTLVFKPSIDTRFDNEKIVTHDNTSLFAINVKDFTEIKLYLENEDADVVGIDEVNFFNGDVRISLDVVDTLLRREETVVVAGLDMDYSAEPFEIVKELMVRADYLYKHHAVCTMCGADAWVSHRKTDSEERIVLGANDEYEPLCRNCYNKLIGK
ncbi:thymidine kinase [Anaerosphaera aminiphila DSM 21120]|uniref:Thymidine kinase n=1 Tax=Anaerosphaera aminiphila DSM 21120 TaxID=1120995 RepID=A0A1M5UFW0_9FIRM|nr:thymidine kinase [Anaerosphaera aminiphila]SHH61837.1 thymidine kinase [Anaerosphaera aminiphila DSM 21120]